MVAVQEHFPSAISEPVQRLGEPNREALDGAGEQERIIDLDNQVQKLVIQLKPYVSIAWGVSGG